MSFVGFCVNNITIRLNWPLHFVQHIYYKFLCIVIYCMNSFHLWHFVETRVLYGQPFWLVAFSTIWRHHHHIFIMIFIFWAPLSMVQLIKIAQPEILFNLLSILHLFPFRNLFLHRNFHDFCLGFTPVFMYELHLCS